MRIDNPTFPTGHTSDSEAFLPELLVDMDVTSSVAQVDLVIPASKRNFTSYFIMIHQLRVDTTSGDLKLRFSFDEGATFELGSTDYEYVGLRMNGTTAANFSSSGANALFITDPSSDVAASGGKGYNGMVWTHFLGDLNNLPWVYFQGAWINTAGTRQTARGSGHYDNASRPGTGFGQVNAFRFFISGPENILRGQFRLYGID
jgi:hypothetical protein